MKFKKLITLSIIAISTQVFGNVTPEKPNNNIPFELDSNDIKAFSKPKYQISGCVEVEFIVNKNNKPTEISMTKHYPENAFTNQAYNKIVTMNHTFKNLKKETTYLQFNGSENWPLPYECLTISKKSELKINTQNQFLSNTKLSKIKESIDNELFYKIYKNIDIKNSTPTTTKRENGNFDVSITYTWTYKDEALNNYLEYFFKPIYGNSKNKNISSISIKKNLYNKNYTDDVNQEAINYIGQRKLVIEAILNNKKQTFIVGTPIKEESFCKGTSTNKLDFDSYCFITENKKGHKITFENLEEKELKQLSAYSRFRIENTYLK
jgi:hypothetical protein